MFQALPLLTGAQAWAFVSRLGEAQILIPALLAVAAWLIWRGSSTRLALLWLGATAAMATLTAITKIAFIGWEIGIEPLDFTGISGHAMFSAAILPLFARLSEGSVLPRWHHWPTAAGYGVAALIAVSRVAVDAHSVSEAAAGFVVGALASAAVLMFFDPPRVRVPAWIPFAVLAWLTLGVHSAPPSQTHNWITQVALELSGRPQPYARWQMHYRARLEQRRHEIAAQAAGHSAPGR
jgi:membrane-associated phospholipid phosphatase